MANDMKHTEGEVMLLKGNEAIAHAAIRCGVDVSSAILSLRKVKS